MVMSFIKPILSPVCLIGLRVGAFTCSVRDKFLYTINNKHVPKMPVEFSDRCLALPKATSITTISAKSKRTKTDDNQYQDQADQGNLETLNDSCQGNHRTFLVVGLGNHGHPDTRHSVGMLALDMFASRMGSTWENRKKDYGGFLSKTRLRQADQEIELLMFKPKALMNINGVSVAKTANSLGLCPSHIYLIHDELERAVGKYNIKEGGSALGHKGVLSCMNCLRSKAMPRLRIGIGRPHTQSEIVSYVLSNFSSAEREVVNKAVSSGLELLIEHIWKQVDLEDGVS